ncbi:Zinc finger protein [Schistosoma japonicum]|uniref:Zinc finger protein n=1 Tax=Schistosoma japonicum TaxID=6182 RepID=A0A4Z2DVL7_SCHJA|nr:Zinc finger protein [Schistosoma japonicum]
MVSQPIISSSRHIPFPSDDVTIPVVSDSLNINGVHSLNNEYLPYILSNFLNQNQNQICHNDYSNLNPYQQQSHNSEILNFPGFQLPFIGMLTANHSNKMNNSIQHNNPLINIAANLKNPENFMPITNFSLTASLTKAISSNTNSIGSQLLPICTPLLQLAVRQALAECFPNHIQLNIKGRLDISVNTINNNAENSSISSTILNFNDDNQELMTKLPNFLNDLQQGDINPVLQKLVNIPYSQHSTSRRKPLHPSKCYLSDVFTGNNDRYENNNIDNGNNFNSLRNYQSVSPLLSTSSPTSPSSDSGVLDLSHGGSLADSAPITPLKEIHISSNNYLNNFNSDDRKHNFNLRDQLEQFDAQFNREKEILESYKKQLAAFNHIQAVWKMSTSNTETSLNPSLKPEFNEHDDLVIQKPNSEPSTPGKTGRRGRIGNGLTGRFTTIRRPSTNRRFPCNQCKEEFPSLHTLEQHTLSQHGTYRCHICQAQFTQRSNLQRHALKHVGFKPFECRVCSKAYYRKDHLMRHMEMGHPGFTPRDNITVHLTSSESLDFLTRSNGLNETHSIEDTYEQRQHSAFNDETMIGNEYNIDNESNSVDDSDGHQSTSLINKSDNTDSGYFPIKDQKSSSISEETIHDSTETMQ